MTVAVAIEAIRLARFGHPPATLVEAVSFSLDPGATLGIVGESGSGKSLVALATMGLLPSAIRAEGTLSLDGIAVQLGDGRAFGRVRGGRIGMVFQEPMTALNPTMRVGDQIAEGLVRHKGVGRAAARAEALRLLERVRIPEAARRLDAFPHELSGGQRQRVGIAIALAPGPSLLIADEPTTALDVTVQAEVLALLGELVADLGMGLVLISHDLGVVASIAERTLVMRAGRVVEQGETDRVLRRPAHAYTAALIAARPRPAEAVPRTAAASGPTVLDVRNLRRAYTTRDGRGPATAVDGVSFTVEAGTVFGVVGESGCGKSTLARVAMGLDRPTGGTVLFDGTDLFAAPGRDVRRLRRGFQMVFQDPQGSLDPRQTVGRIVAEPLHLVPDAPRGRARRALVADTLRSVGLEASDADRHPHAFSGGQRQRIAIARAIVGRPKLVVADEPVSALDSTVQAQVLRLIAELRDRHGIAFLFISHSLAVVETIADRVGVMAAGRFVETGTAAEVFRRPRHPYTRRLIDAEPSLDQPRRYGRPAAASIGEPVGAEKEPRA